MKFLASWLPQLNAQVWILVAGRLLSGIGSGFTLFYAPIYFANEVGLSKTAVGLALGSISISGVFGRILGGSLADSPVWGRRNTLLLSNLVLAIACFIIAAARDFPTLVAGNLLLGLGGGLYWPPAEAAIADLTTSDNRQEAYAITRLGDSLGLQLGTILGGVLISLTHAYRALFVIDAISFLVFFGIIWGAIAETSPSGAHVRRGFDGWGTALRDRALLVYVVVNIMFTTYISQTQTSMPLYFSNFVSTGETGKGFSPAMISGLFTWHLTLSAVLQLPVARFLKRFSHAQALAISAMLWAVGFILIGVTGVVANNQLFVALLGLGVLAIATVAYTPTASSFVVDLAPESLRGVYLSINSQCWAVGYFIGPTLGGFVLDLPRPISDELWAALALSAGGAIAILLYLNRIVKK